MSHHRPHPELVFAPPPGVGHLVSTIELAKRLLLRHDSLSVTVLCINFGSVPNAHDLTDSLLAGPHSSRIKLRHLPPAESLPPELWQKSLEHCVYVSIESVVPHARAALKDIVSASGSVVVALVLDFLCMPFLDVGRELGIPSYMFMTSNVGFLGLMLDIPARHDRVGSEFDPSDQDVTVSGFRNAVPMNVLPSAAFSRDGGYDAFVKLARRFRDTKGILVNSFSELESCSFDVPLYLVGPVIDVESRPNQLLDNAKRQEIIQWLDDQPPSSVVFLCFGSMGTFGVSQVREIAEGLDRSGFRFLWCMRLDGEETLDQALPERIAGRGMVVHDWVPQAEVLAHGAVGGFVSHCGWNSILESLWHGVPIVTWPMYAEQQTNAFRMVREFGMAVEMRLDYRYGSEDIVGAEEVEVAVRRVMEEGSEVRVKVKEMSEVARKAVLDGGSAFNALGQFLNDVLATL